ncbi:hypothetical protein BDQ17DRAFT_1367888 [Cyathus striatus]|nr:hypothetical protein BDQ17DRAFT_1367888 [Cyathus striatus]
MIVFRSGPMKSQTAAPPPVPPKDELVTKLMYASSATRMLQEIGDGSGILQLRTIASWTQLIIEYPLPHTIAEEFKTDYTKAIEGIYTLICAIIHMCKCTNVNLSASSLTSLEKLIKTLKAVHTAFRIQPKGKKLVKGLDIRSIITKYTIGIDQAKKEFPIKFGIGITTSNCSRMHLEVLAWHRSVTAILLRRHLKRSDESVWSLPDTLRPSKDREPELEQIVSSLLEATQGTSIAILGPKDTGKTSLALSVMHHSEMADHFGSRRHFLQCTSASTMGELMMIFAQSFGLESAQENHQEAIFEYLNTITGPVLVVLDGYESLWDVIEKKTCVEDFVPLLCSIPHVSVLLTITDTSHTGPTVIRWTCPLMSPLQVQHVDEKKLGSDISSTIRASTIVENSKALQGTSTSNLTLKQLFLRIPRSHKLYRGLGVSAETMAFSLPLFPCNLYSLNLYRQYAASILKYTALSVTSFSRSQWKTRYLVLSVPVFGQYLKSASPGVAYLHLFKSSAPDAEEVDRLRIDDETLVISSEPNTTGDKHTIRVCGINARNTKQSENKSQELTTWRIQIHGNLEARTLKTVIRDSVREQWCLSPLQKSSSDSLCDSQTSGNRISIYSSSQAGGNSHISCTGQGSEHTNNELTPVYQRLYLVIKDPAKYREFLRSRGNKAQLLLDFLQELIDYPKLDSKFRGELIHALRRLSKKSDLYPACFLLKDVQLVGDCPLAGGHSCEVWKGILKKRTVCLKVVRIYATSVVTDLLRSFAVEALIWGQYSHINLLPFYGIYRMSDSHNKVCLVSPWMENGNINEFLEHNPGSNRLLLALDILQGIIYLHRHNVVHGDLKGPNILIAPNGRACIADFGLSAMVDSDALRWTSLTSTVSNVGGGTVRWQAPELLCNFENEENRPPSRRSQASDIYAYACVCYEIFTGEYPFFEIQYDVTVMMKVLHRLRPSRPHKSSRAFTRFGLTEDIWRTMTYCWDHTPSKRPTAVQINEYLTSGKTISDKRPRNGWENLSPLCFRNSIHKYPNLSDLDSLLP